MPTQASVGAAIEQVRGLPDLHAATACARSIALACAESQRVEVRAEAGGTDALAGGPRERWDTALGNVVDVLDRGARTSDEQLLLGCLVALGAHAARTDEPDPAAVAARLTWLATHTTCNALTSIDAAAGGDAGEFWEDIARLVGAEQDAPPLAERLVAAFALRSSRSPRAEQLVQQLETQVSEPALRAVLSASPRGEASSPSPLVGELGWRPRGAVATTLFALSGWLFIRACLHLVARFALALRRPTELRLSEQGLEVRYRVEMLGRLLKQREIVVPIANLSRVSREIRYRQIGLYAGLLALALGTYLGVGLLVDGARAPGSSPPLLGLGAAIVIAGLVIDFALSALPAGHPTTVRLVVHPRAGSPMCVRGVDAHVADETLRALAQRPGYQSG